MYTVYMHTFPNGKRYIGITSQKPEYRWDNGNGYLKKGKRSEFGQPLIARAIQKYSWEKVKHTILFENLTKGEAEKKEIELIAAYKSNDPSFGYNTDNGGRANKMTEAQKEKLRKALKGHQRTVEARKKQGETIKGLWAGERNPMYGRYGTANPKSRKVAQYTKSGELVRVWDSMGLAERELGIAARNISGCCRHVRGRKTLGGFRWEYWTETEETAI